ncbi:hypothetical protein Pcinc_030169 [Petrolisthes cinctipes]|uniref:C2H2-type domain-containing protein n=1 Tax=Petrolisthes cinctipes TaxID=88211 RepID=A0AAE1EZC0_PETCI|nr:hypothetical protein Pcinc_030169 [Petrolisthes cinctipes]
MPEHTVFKKLEVVSDLCDLCGDNHAITTCPVLSHLGVPGRPEEHREPHLAYQSLPEWVQVQPEGAGGMVRLLVTEKVPKFTRLGPLLAPHTPHLTPHNTFPLKICHEGGSYTYLDLSRKWLCNWLSLVPVGSPTNKNLLACQIDDLIYFMSSEDIEAGSELLVWYASFYLPRIQEELRQLASNTSLGQDQSLLGAPAVTRRLSTKPSLVATYSTESSHAVSSSLARISVGRGQITFTHNNAWVGETVNHIPPHSSNQLSVTSPISNFHMGGKGDASDTLIVRQTQTSSNPGEYLQNGLLHGREEEQVVMRPRYEYSLSGRDEPKKSIQVIMENSSVSEKNCVVSLTITATGEGQEPHWCRTEHLRYDGVESSLSGDGETLLLSQHKKHKRKYIKSREKPAVLVADSSLVKQLPPRALGARLQRRSWDCNYCGQNYRTLTTFADHLKAHLLWVVGRQHVCKECGLSLSNPEQLHQHMESAHNTTPSSTSPSRGVSHTGKRKQGMTVEDGMDAEDEDDIDDPGGNSAAKKTSTQDNKRISALPTVALEGPHNCQICSKSFAKPQYLLRHLRKHSGDFTCQVCLKVFARKEGLQKHQCAGGGAGGNQQRVSCSKCFRSFPNATLLHQHMLRHQESLKCKQCGWRCATLASLQRHVSLCPSVQVSRFFQCTECGKRMSSTKQLERHSAQHRQNFVCHICSKPYNSSTYLAQHIPLCRQMHQITSAGFVACEDCNEKFTDSTAFRLHHHTHTHPFHCWACNQRFQTRVTYEIHVCEVEQRCDKCGAVFRSVQALNRHAAIHGPPPHSCSSCNRSYYRKESLDRHVCCCEAELKKQKTKDQSFPCHLCGSVLATKYRLSTHLVSAHGEGGGHQLMCEVCGKGFQRRDLLREHQAVHSPPTHPCPTCHKLFKTRKSLDVHLLIHLDIKRFACKYCNKRFHQKVQLGRHERSHLPRGLVKCQYCATQCSSTADLKAHLLSHTILETSGTKLHNHQSVFTIKKEEPVTNETLVSLGQGADDQSLPEKERLGLKGDKNSKDPNSDFSSGIVNTVVPVITSDLSLHTNSLSDHHQTVFIPQRISNICLSTTEEPLNSNYIVATQPEIIASSASPQNICNSSVFKVTNNSSSDNNTLPSTVLITTSQSPEHCQVSVVGAEEADNTRHMSTEDASKISPLTLGQRSTLVEEVCLYQPTATISPDNSSQHSPHVLESDQLVESVVLMAEPSNNNC